MLCKQSCFRKVLYGVVQRFCECFNKRAASGGAGFIQLHAVNHVVFDLDTFHILAADIEDAVYVRVKEGRGVIVGDGLHLALVQHQRGLYQSFAVAGRTGPGNIGFLRKLMVDVEDRPDRRAERIAVIITVERVQQRAVLCHQSGFCCGRAGIDTEKTVSLVRRKRTCRDTVAALTCEKVAVVFF